MTACTSSTPASLVADGTGTGGETAVETVLRHRSSPPQSTPVAPVVAKRADTQSATADLADQLWLADWSACRLC